jgi:hypothetical protein
MRDVSIFLPLDATPKLGFAGWAYRALSWPARVLEARRAMAMLGEISEREWQDIEPGRRDLLAGRAFAREDDPAEGQARARAIRAWYRHDAKAA